MSGLSELPEGNGEGAVASVDYATYLQLPQLLALQRPLAQPAVHDEMLFVIVHQTHELWFKQVIWELREAISQIDSGCWPAACQTLQRVSSIVALLVQHVAVLETMPPSEFKRFRSGLGSASGVQSVQFREIEMLSGYLPSLEQGVPSAPSATLQRSASLRQAFLRACSCAAPESGLQLRAQGSADDSPGKGRPVKGGLAEQRLSEVAPAELQLRRLYRDPGRDAQRCLADGLLDLDEQVALWRASHVRLVRAMIGDTMGTGGSSGVRYLQETLEQRLLPELLAARQAEQDEARARAGLG